MRSLQFLREPWLDCPLSDNNDNTFHSSCDNKKRSSDRNHTWHGTERTKHIHIYAIVHTWYCRLSRTSMLGQTCWQMGDCSISNPSMCIKTRSSTFYFYLFADMLLSVDIPTERVHCNNTCESIISRNTSSAPAHRWVMLFLFICLRTALKRWRTTVDISIPMRVPIRYK